MRKTLAATILSICLALVAGWSHADSETWQQQDLAEMEEVEVVYGDSQDTLEGFNRVMFSFNENVDKVTLKPIAQVYQAVLPKVAQTGVANFFSNLNDIPNALNNFLQFKLIDAASDIGRVVVNSTVGILGLFDVASPIGLKKHEEDFGQTFAYWGVGSGPYIVLPFLGPSTLRDATGDVVGFISPVQYPWPNVKAANISLAVEVVEDRSQLLGRERVLRDLAKEMATDLYSAVRAFYLAQRNNLINDGQLNTDELDDLYLE